MKVTAESWHFSCRDRSFAASQCRMGIREEQSGTRSVSAIVKPRRYLIQTIPRDK